MDEMQECRVTVGRMDTLLQDLRKFGFSLVTGLLTASGIVGGIAGNRDLLPPAAVVVMVLVLALFGVDTFYQVVLSGAARRRSARGRGAARHAPHSSEAPAAA